MFRLGRITLWILCFPLGLWRSVRHGQKKSEKKLLAEMRRNRATS
jgi:hypothetical protein